MAPSGKGRKGSSLILGLVLLGFGIGWLLHRPVPEPLPVAPPSPVPTAVALPVTETAEVATPPPDAG